MPPVFANAYIYALMRAPHKMRRSQFKA